MSEPGAASATGSTTGGGSHGSGSGGDHHPQPECRKKCDATVTLEKYPNNQHGGNLGPDDFQLLLDGQPQLQHVALVVTPDVKHIVSEIAQPGYELRVIKCLDANTGKLLSHNGVVTLSAGQQATCKVLNDDIAPSITVHKKVVNDNGGTAVSANFQLTLNGHPVSQDLPNSNIMANQPSVISEDGSIPGYAPTSVVCTSDIANSPNNKSVDNSSTIGVTPAPAENIDCTITNGDTAPGLTVIKAVKLDDGGNEQISDFPLQVNGVTVPSGSLIAYAAGVDLAVTETQKPGYVASNVSCVSSDPLSANNTSTSNPTGTLATVSLEVGESVVCTITNDDIAPTVTVHKTVVGGTKPAGDFQVTVAGQTVRQDTAVNTRANAPIEVSEVADPNYVKTNVACVDNADNQPLAHPLTLNEAQSATCTVTNTFQSPTITVVKDVTNSWGGGLHAADFQLTIDLFDAGQGVPHGVSIGAHTVGEVQRPGYEQTGIECVDLETNAVVGQGGSVDLAAGQHLECIVSNADIAPTDVPLDLAITKSDNGAVQVAGGAPFDYTITVDNLGPGDPAADAEVTMTDQLPSGLRFVSFPVNCTKLDQTLTCLLDPGGLQVADPPIVITVTVAASPDAPSGTYTNKAYVNIAGDAACAGPGCVPVCDVSNNNVACENTALTRQASLTIDKVDDVVAPISPGATYSYLLTVTNGGPSTFLADLTVTDDLPNELSLVSITADPSWSCPVVDPIVCSYNLDLQPGVSAPVIKITVKLDPSYTVVGVHNVAIAVAVIGPPVGGGVGIGATVTATDDEDTPIVRTADLAIDKSVSQSTVEAGGVFNWVLDITNKGPDTATNLVVSDTVPAEFEVIGVFPIGGLSCTNTTSSVQCTAASLAVGGTLTVVVQVRVVASAASGPVSNTATVTSSSTDVSFTDNTDSDSITVTASGSEAPVPSAPAPIRQLPRTGNGPLDGPLSISALLLSAGLLSVLIARRRRSATA